MLIRSQTDRLIANAKATAAHVTAVQLYGHVFTNGHMESHVPVGSRGSPCLQPAH